MSEINYELQFAPDADVIGDVSMNQFHLCNALHIVSVQSADQADIVLGLMPLESPVPMKPGVMPAKLCVAMRRTSESLWSWVTCGVETHEALVEFLSAKQVGSWHFFKRVLYVPKLAAKLNTPPAPQLGGGTSQDASGG